MRRTPFVASVLLVGVVVAGCTSTSRGSSAGQSHSVSPSATATPTPAFLSSAEADSVVASYDHAVVAAARSRNVIATRAIQTGSLLTMTLAGYQYTQRAHQTAAKPVAVYYPDALVPAITSTHNWFIERSFSASAGGAAYASLFEQAGPEGPWRKSLEVWMGPNHWPDPAVVAGGAAVASSHQATLDAAAVAALSHYLSSGRVADHLKVGPARDTRSQLRRNAEPPAGSTSTLRCSRPSGAAIEALQWSGGTELVAGLQCTITVRARPGWHLTLTHQWKVFANKSQNLRGFSVHLLVQTAMTVSPQGVASVAGVTWQTTGVTAH